MNVLADILLPAPSLSPEFGSHHKTTRILSGGRRTHHGDEEHLRLFSKIFHELGEDTSSDALCMMLPFTWDERAVYDTVNPFGDRRQNQYDALWTFDIANDVLFHTNRDRRSRVPLALLRERIVTPADLKPLGPAVPLPLEPSVDSGTPYWKPRVEVDERIRAFTHRVLRDFNHQWRHMLRNTYNSVTLRVLARAIVRLSTLHFKVREETEERLYSNRGSYVWITHLPEWEPLEAEIVCVGNVYVFLCQSIQEGLSMARQHATSQDFTKPGDLPHYMILSVRHIVLCRVTCPNNFEHTAPEPLFNGDYCTGPPSDLALDYLIWATANARASIPSSLQLLPVEIQDIILNYVSAGTVAAAKIGCLLGLGTPFRWKDGLFNVELEEFYRKRGPGSPVESQVWFDEHKSGIVYKGHPCSSQKSERDRRLFQDTERYGS